MYKSYLKGFRIRAKNYTESSYTSFRYLFKTISEKNSNYQQRCISSEDSQ